MAPPLLYEEEYHVFFCHCAVENMELLLTVSESNSNRNAEENVARKHDLN